MHHKNKMLRKWRLRGHPCPIPIFMPTERYKAQYGEDSLNNVIDIQNNKLSNIYKPLLNNLKNSGKTNARCFIIGNGPSLNETRLECLQNEVTFGVNGIFLKENFLPTFYVVEDHLVAEDRAKQINALDGVIKIFPVYLAYCLDEGPDTIFFNHLPRKSYPHGFDFSTDAENVTYTGGTVTYTCMQLAYYMGFKEIYLVGVDHEYSIPKSAELDKAYSVEIIDMQDDDPNHFSSDYFGKGYRWHNPRSDVMERAYIQAKKVTEEHGVKILNATIGGKLEIFERVEYNSLFQSKNTELVNNNCVAINAPVCEGVCVGRRADLFDYGRLSGNLNKRHPKVLIVSSTRMNDYSATGSLVKSMFAGWPRDRIAQVYASAGLEDITVTDYCYRLSRRGTNIKKVIGNILSFNPDVIYFRMTAEPLVIWEFMDNAIQITNASIVTHIMDDWPERERIKNPVNYVFLINKLCRILDCADINLAISETMALAMGSRYGRDFGVLSNFIHINDWCNLKYNTKNNDDFVIRYTGSLAGDMQLESVTDVALAVQLLQDKIPVKFEIYVHDRFRSNAERLRKYKGVSIKSYVPESQYRELLSNADILLLPVNFDTKSLAYVRYSLANKLPEYMASGSCILAYGPPESATISYVMSNGVAEVVWERDVNRLVKSIQNLYENHEKRSGLIEIAKKFVFERHDAKIIKNKFQSTLCDLVSSDEVASDNLLIGEYDRENQAHINEADIVIRYLGYSSAERTIINVGAHYGSEIPLFLQYDYEVHAFEPDINNLKVLNNRFSNSKNVFINNFAVSDRIAESAEWYSSNQSTGISSLAPFHESHCKSEKVQVTTLDHYINHNHIENVDVLFIDAEGYDFMVLKGFPWEDILPIAVICEFEDRKTLDMGFDYKDIAKYLINLGYEVYLSEWHPIIKYGIRHEWRQLAMYPSEVKDPNAWGNIIALQKPVDTDRLITIVNRQIQSNYENIQCGLFKKVKNAAKKKIFNLYYKFL